MAQQPKRESAARQATVELDDRGQSLSHSLSSLLTDFPVEISAALNEVTAAVSPQDVLSICRLMKDRPDLQFDYLRCLCVVDYDERLEVDYHLFSLEHRHKMVLKTDVLPDAPAVPSVVSVWRAADWFEREGHDLFGVIFEGHPDLAPLLLYDGFEGFPGRKNFPFHDYTEW